VASEEISDVTLDASAAGRRLDVSLAKAFPERSRSFLSRLLKDGSILIDGKEAKPSYKVRGGEHVEVEWPEPEVIEARPEAIPLDILFEDADVIAVNKPAGMCAHPSAGHPNGTLVNALLHHCTDLSSINGAIRPGIVHRLDADTTGVIIAAKNDAAHQALQDQFMARTVRKTYVALCHGTPMHDRFTCEGRIGRHPVRRMEMTVVRSADEGRAAKTDFEVLQRLGGVSRQESGGRGRAEGQRDRGAAHQNRRGQRSEVSDRRSDPSDRTDHPSDSPDPTDRSDAATCCRQPVASSGPLFLVLARPHTGRTHQIRVHLVKAGFPVLSDPLYGREEELPELGLHRHALHAWELEIKHPRTGDPLSLEAPLADDMKGALLALGGRWPL
jgi:23S rRNA pseudouridine1911/1915/1917 synthase